MSTQSPPAPSPRHSSPSTLAWLAQMIRALPGYVGGLFAFSLAVNLLLLVSPIYMLQVYDRVLSSGSRDTLVWMTVIAVFLLAIYAAAEAGRRRLAALAGARLDSDFSARAFRRFRDASDTEGSLARDLTDIAKFQSPFQHGTLLAFLDLPFAPLFIGILFLIHPLLGVLSVVGALIVLAVALAAEAASRNSSEKSGAATLQAGRFADGLSRQRSALIAMGLVDRAYAAWRGIHAQAEADTVRASRRDSVFAATSRAVRQILQVFILGAGAALFLQQQLSPGGIVAASIILSRALAPIDMIVGSWRSVVQAKAAWGRVDARLAQAHTQQAHTQNASTTSLPRPEALLALDRLAAQPPGAEVPLIRPFSTEIAGGQLVVLTGGNGAGKTTLLQTLAGAWSPAAGEVRLGGVRLHSWPSRDRGRHVGYVPQGVELFPGTVADNISRLRSEPSEAEGAEAIEETIEMATPIFAAAQAAGAHGRILALPDAYDTRVGPGGVHLSAGQTQLIGLARALYGRPVLVLLDEPTANLDTIAAQAAANALRAHADRGGIVVAASHDPRLVGQADLVLDIRDGAVSAKAPKRGSGTKAAATAAATGVAKVTRIRRTPQRSAS